MSAAENYGRAPAPKYVSGGQILTDEERQLTARAEAAMLTYQGTWQECLAFFDNNQYVELNKSRGVLDDTLQREITAGSTGYQPRVTRNKYTDGLLSEVAWCTSRFPGFEVTPRNGDPGPSHQARMGEKVLLDLWERLNMKGVLIGRLTIAGNCGAGYLWPYWKSDEGRYVGNHPDSGKALYEGEIGFIKLQPDEVLWEPGLTFAEAKTHILRKAYPVESVKKRPGYIGPDELKPNASTARYEMARGPEQQEMVFVYDWLEQPCERYPKGRWLTYLQSGELIHSPRDYPRQSKNRASCIHELSWTDRDHRHRPMGVGERALDIQRSFNRTNNQIIAWANLVLVPQLMAPYGSVIGEPTADPGDRIEYRPIAGMKPEWRAVPDIPQSLFQKLEDCRRDFDDLFGARDLPDTESAQHAATIIEREQSRRGVVIANLARFYSDVGEHMLELVQENYTEQRLIRVQGRFGVDLVADFKGDRDLGGTELSVYVDPTQLTPRSRAAQEAKVMTFVTNGWIPIHQAMAALNAGTAERLIDDFELDIARQHREIKQIIAIAGENADGIPDVTEVVQNTGMEPEQAMELLHAAILEIGPTVEDFDNHEIHIDVISQWMKTVDFEEQPDVVKGVARAHRDQHSQMMAAVQMQQQQAQAGLAEQQGQENAAKPPGEKPEPSRASQETQKSGLE
jgi:hypothetical protein